MDASARSKVPDPAGSAERPGAPQKRKVSSPTHSSNGHSPSDTSPSPVKKKKKPGAIHGNSKDQSELRHGPFYYMKQPALTTDPVDVVPQDGRNDFYCWLCHREGQVLCCELCPRVYHAKCLKLPAEPEGDWFCPECEKITVAECIETQSKAMTLLTLDQLSYLLKFALQKIKQPGTEPFLKPVSLDQHPDYAEYIFHPMDLSTLEKNIKKKMYGCTEAFLADMKWILHNCIIYNGGNHKLTATAKVIVKICEHEMNEIEVCPECYLSSCQKRDNWFCEPCSPPHPLVWAKLKGFPFWPAKALREKDGQVDARFFGQHDRAWVPINNCYLMSKEIPFSVKKTKSIFNSAMQEMEVYVENIRKKFGVFNYAPFRTPFTPNNQLQMLLDPSNPSAGTVKTEKPDKLRFNFDITASPKMVLGKSSTPSMSRRVSMTDMPRSPMSTNSSVHTGSDGEQDMEKPGRNPAFHYSTGEESMDCTASPMSGKMGPGGSVTGSPKPFNPGQVPKQERTASTGGILNLNLDRVKAEMDLKELSETVQQQQQQHQQQQGSSANLPTPKRPIRSLDKTIESCKAQLGIDEISEDVYKGVDHSDSEDSEKSDSSDSEYLSDEDHKPKSSTHEDKDRAERKRPKASSEGESKEGITGAGDKVTSEPQLKDKHASNGPDRDLQDKPKTPQNQPHTEKPKAPEEGRAAAATSVGEQDSDSERELVIDLGDEHGGRDSKRARREAGASAAKTPKESNAVRLEGKVPSSAAAATPSRDAVSNLKDSVQPAITAALNLVSTAASGQTSATTATTNVPSPAATSISATSPVPAAVKKQRPLLPKETAQAVQRAVVWNPTKFQTSSQKWHMQKVQRQQQHGEQSAVQAEAPSQARSPQQLQNSSSSSTRYQTRQAVKVQQKDTPQSTSSSTAAQVTSGSSSSYTSGDLQIPTVSADVAADIAKYTNKIMDSIKGTMTEIYNDLSKSTSGNTIAEIRRLRIEIEKLQWLHQQELSEMKHNLELTMAEMRQSLEQERERLVAEVKKQTESDKQQAVDETKKKQWCANCRKEAIFYCCWNTSYCDYPCQQAHWPEHMKSCTQSASASQQEPEAEPNSDPAVKSSGHSPSTQTLPSAAGSISDKSNSPTYMEKSKDSAGVPVT
ncbi:protein kinase C-binding protein 1-like isoform X3 [Notolabrus celidotus]|nr:protein kinase C-binding protein 1-like isoform X3 [Notolabrus celidotus]XP_034552555.1 protein kinase C-binding protein 1-like isoform X3 [Notolabrus celidotus]XP_034552557.1 protein kinase C-binding protein 1-like isoform X3 [Notolabrus celidotus]